MATYPVVNTKTGEKKEVMMSVTQWDQWCSDNPDWSRDLIKCLEKRKLMEINRLVLVTPQSK